MVSKKQVSAEMRKPTIVEVQITVPPRGRSTAQCTIVRSDGSIAAVNLELSPQQIEALKAMVAAWSMHVDEEL